MGILRVAFHSRRWTSSDDKKSRYNQFSSLPAINPPVAQPGIKKPAISANAGTPIKTNRSFLLGGVQSRAHMDGRIDQQDTQGQQKRRIKGPSEESI